jgi:Ca2+-binding EF-hand superfamily protein
MMKYKIVVISSTPSVATSFASTVTREPTHLDDPHGVWQKDKGGRFNNFMSVVLETQDEQSRPINLGRSIPLVATLHGMSEEGVLGEKLDVVSRKDTLVQGKHLEGAAHKLFIITAYPDGRGLQLGPTAITTVRVRINELSKKKNRLTVVFTPEPVANLSLIGSVPKMPPIMVYSKLVHHNPTSSTIPMEHSLDAEPGKELMLARDLLSRAHVGCSDEDLKVFHDILEQCRIIQKKIQWQKTSHVFATLSATASSRHLISTQSAPSSMSAITTTTATSNSSSNNSSNQPTKKSRSLPPSSPLSDNNVGLEFLDDGINDLEQFLDGWDNESTTSNNNNNNESSNNNNNNKSAPPSRPPVNIEAEVRITPCMLTLELFDLDGDGTVTRSEMKHAINARLELPISEDMHERIFSEFDTNNDGIVTLEEFVAGVKKREDELGPLFDEIDLNGDGYLTFDELRASSILKDVSNDAIRDLIAFVDSLSQEQPDGKISKKEFITTFTMLPSGDSLEKLLKQ